MCLVRVGHAGSYCLITKKRFGDVSGDVIDGMSLRLRAPVSRLAGEAELASVKIAGMTKPGLRDVGSVQGARDSVQASI